MTKCKLCGNETEYPCGPRDAEICPSCWLAIGADDEIAKQADDFQEAAEKAARDCFSRRI